MEWSYSRKRTKRHVLYTGDTDTWTVAGRSFVERIIMKWNNMQLLILIWFFMFLWSGFTKTPSASWQEILIDWILKHWYCSKCFAAWQRCDGIKTWVDDGWYLKFISFWFKEIQGICPIQHVQANICQSHQLIIVDERYSIWWNFLLTTHMQRQHTHIHIQR